MKIINIRRQQETIEGETNEIFVFELAPDATVNMSSDSCQSDLKALFSKLLQELINSEGIELSYVPEAAHEGTVISMALIEFVSELNKELVITHQILQDEFADIIDSL